ncbi:hypothetical protein [Pseudobutyrivibrio sp.]|uniref:hypothetical protein n=1 Tax=Pseudobutyrivibrio sp. TaxID=2014367 RepID=UPI001B5679E8|nr:hypothetical protein [Pseudobutyrivibrio sp.]MBP5596840.1 hypothetical protein [Pseudobutyrivibrio sp.]MBR5649139.1 hypothetical protein [Pseudobutyrivibrio sp.]
MLEVHESVDKIFKTVEVPSMLKNEYNNKVSQYENMYESVETMKSMAQTEEAKESLINQQIEILNVRIKCEVELAKKAAAYKHS